MRVWHVFFPDNVIVDVFADSFSETDRHVVFFDERGRMVARFFKYHLDMVLNQFQELVGPQELIDDLLRQGPDAGEKKEEDI